MGNPKTEKTKRCRAKNPVKERNRKRCQRLRSKERMAKLTPEERAELKARLRSRRTSRLRRLLRSLSEAQNHRCCYCGHKTWLEGIDCDVKRERWNEATKEHINPRSNGGTYGKYNLVMACHSCNNARGVMPYEDFIALITKEPKKHKPHIRQQKAKEDREERAVIRQAMFDYSVMVYLSYLTEEQWQIVNGWVEKYKNEVVPSGKETFANRHKRKEKKGCKLTKIRYRVRQSNMHQAIALSP